MCRFYIAVGRVAVDASAILFERRIKLAQPPFGIARVVFTAQDFGAFLIHPLMVKAASTAVQVRQTLYNNCLRLCACTLLVYTSVAVARPEFLTQHNLSGSIELWDILHMQQYPWLSVSIVIS